MPVVCGGCHQPAKWATMKPLDEPTVAYDLTVNDRRFLRTLRIAASEDE